METTLWGRLLVPILRPALTLLVTIYFHYSRPVISSLQPKANSTYLALHATDPAFSGISFVILSDNCLAESLVMAYANKMGYLLLE